LVPNRENLKFSDIWGGYKADDRSPDPI